MNETVNKRSISFIFRTVDAGIHWQVGDIKKTQECFQALRGKFSKQRVLYNTLLKAGFSWFLHLISCPARLVQMPVPYGLPCWSSARCKMQG